MPRSHHKDTNSMKTVYFDLPNPPALYKFSPVRTTSMHPRIKTPKTMINFIKESKKCEGDKSQMIPLSKKNSSVLFPEWCPGKQIYTWISFI